MLPFAAVLTEPPAGSPAVCRIWPRMFLFGLWRQVNEANCENYLKCIFKVINKDEATHVILYLWLLLQSQVVSNLKKQKKCFVGTFLKIHRDFSNMFRSHLKILRPWPPLWLCLNFEILPHSQTTTQHHSYTECMDWLFSVWACCHVHVNKVKPH